MPSLRLHQGLDDYLFISKPLNSVEDLKQWNEGVATDINNKATIKLQQRQKNLDTSILVTHDMAGGYKEDNWIQGRSKEHIYSLQYWQLIDMFAYFSHSRVTIPPVVWTNACHRNGVLSLGTFLVEGDDGTAELEKLLYGFHYDDNERNVIINNNHDANDPKCLWNPSKADKIEMSYEFNDPMQLWSPFYADKLVAIAKFYGFDGWLFNIESDFYSYPIPSQYKAQQLVEFLDYFKKKLHSEIPGSKLIWYDSLTRLGKVHWQNQLTDENKRFFEVTDGIFLNYWWKEDYPKKAKELAEEMGNLIAHIENHNKEWTGNDVYFGVDVWGRKTYGGGNFNSYKGVQTAYKDGLSSAIFAPAWTYENFGSQKFEKMDRKFWIGDQEKNVDLNIKEKEKSEEEKEKKEDKEGEGKGKHPHPGVVSTIRPVPEKFWFSTFFDRGFGSAYYFNGKEILTQPWSHLSHQSIPPSFPNGKLDKKDAFIGGTSIILYNDSKYTKLYKLSLELVDELELQYAYKPMVDNEEFNIICQLSIVLYTNNVDTPLNVSFREDSLDNKYMIIINSTSTKLNNGWIMKTVQLKRNYDPLSEISTAIIINELGFIVGNNKSSNIEQQPLLETVRLGFISMVPKNTNSSLITTVSNTNSIESFEWKDVYWKQHNDNNNTIGNVESNGSNNQFWGTLNWNWKQPNNNNNNNTPWDQVYFVMISTKNSDFQQDKFLGTSFTSQFRISGLNLQNFDTAELLVQPVNFLGQIQNNYSAYFPAL